MLPGKCSRRGAVTCAFFALVTASRRADAIRPFVTDDARVVGHKLAQLESWVLVDPHALEHNLLGAVGPTNWLEVTAGFLHGGVHAGSERGYSITGPIVQGKALLHPAEDGSWPGFAVALGLLPPFGHHAFTPPGLSGFGYLAVTESLFQEDLLVHANLGLALGDDGHLAEPDRLRALVTAGFGFQARVLAGLHLVFEVYHGDPFDPHSEYGATQIGFRYIVSEQVQIDSTFGTTLVPIDEGGERRHVQHGTLGLRLVSPELW